MRVDRRRILLFFLQFVVVFAAMLVVYWIVLPWYQPIVLKASNVVLERLDPPTRMEIDVGEWRAYVTERDYKRVFMMWERWVPHLIFLGLALLPALLLATPAPLIRRLQLLAIGLPPLFVLHVVSIIWIVHANYTLMYLNPENFAAQWHLRVAYLSGQTFAALIWALLTWRYWFVRDSGGASPRRAGASPAGSGL